jgi:hypothetical protein
MMNKSVGSFGGRVIKAADVVLAISDPVVQRCMTAYASAVFEELQARRVMDCALFVEESALRWRMWLVATVPSGVLEGRDSIASDG